MKSSPDDRGKPRPKFVEFVGAAGVGKSFLVEKLLEELRARGKAVRCVDSIRWRTSLKGLVVLAEAAYLAALTRPSTLSRYAESTKRLALYITRRLSCANEEGFHLASDGMFQKMRALGRRSTSLGMTSIADVLLRYLAPPDVVVIVRASPATIFERRKARGGRNDRFSLDSVQEDVRLTAETMSTVTHVQRQRATSLHVVEVDLEKTDAHDVAVRLADHLMRTFDESLSPAPAPVVRYEPLVHRLD